ncbi:MAG: nucleotidyltransferase family protein [Candidatus Devosia symbiotica]|nr:nucleotidyltransferase family protein [Candidatus Devosia symbiotica]
MVRFEPAIISDGSSIREALTVIESNGLQIALVVDADGVLTGTVTDGDIRRGMLSGIDFNAGVDKVMNRSPRTVGADAPPAAARALMNKHRIHQIPVLDVRGRVTDVRMIEDFLDVPEATDTTVFLMAGGLGTRLRPITDTIPKPMINVGGKPILESIIGNFSSQGFVRFVLSVKYKAEMIREHFGDGTRFGVEITYVEEIDRKGTAGSLSLLSQRPSGPFIVMNGDLLTTVNFKQLIAFHREHNAVATMCVREYSFKVPYGVIITEDHRITSLQEKPTHTALVNAGIYVLDPAALDRIPADRQYDMTDLFNELLETNRQTAAFPLHEYWLDIGRMEDLERAHVEYSGIFP